MISIRQRLLIWLLSALTLAAAAADLTTYLKAKAELDTLFDNRLREIALSAGHQLTRSSTLASEGDNGDADGPVVQVWDSSGVLLRSSHPSVNLPKPEGSGWTTMSWQNQEWRFYVLPEHGWTIRVGESLEARRETTADIALEIIKPLTLTFIPALALLTWIAVGRSLRPLKSVTNWLGRRRPEALDALPEEDLPREIRPLVRALNDLLQRVGRALEHERQFIADAAHELQTPLTAVRLQLQVLARAVTEDEKTKALKRLELGMQRAIHLVGQLLTMARLDPDVARAPLVEVNLAELVIEVVGEYAVIAQKKGIDLGASALESARVTGERNSLRILLGNLIDNALRYSPEHGKVDVNLRNDKSGPVLEVVDSGPGIPTEERERVFDRFYRSAASATPGSGLGLAIVKRIADQHRATLVLDEGTDGRGLRIEVHFWRSPR